MSKTKRIFSIIFRYFTLITAALVVLMILFLIFATAFTAGNDELLSDNKTITQISLSAMLLALPSTLYSLLKIVTGSKMKFNVEQKCPECKELIHYKITQDSP